MFYAYLRLLGKVGGVEVQLLGLRVQAFLIEIGLGHTHVQMVHQGLKYSHSMITSFSSVSDPYSESGSGSRGLKKGQKC